MGSSSLTRDQTSEPLQGARSLSYWTTREVPAFPLGFIFQEKNIVKAPCGGELQLPWEEALSSPSALGGLQGPRGRRPWDYNCSQGPACLPTSRLGSWKRALKAPDPLPFEFLKFLEGDPGFQEPALDCRGGGAGGRAGVQRGSGCVHTSCAYKRIG